MASLAHHLYTMACNNAWANHRLLERLRAAVAGGVRREAHELLPVDQGDAQPHPHRRLVLRRCARARLQERVAEPRHRRVLRSGGAVRHDRRAQDRAARRPTAGWSRCAAGSTEADVDRPIPIVRSDGVHLESATRLLAHLFQHQIHHRGQVHAMLAGTRVKPPQLDEFFCANEAHLRADDLAEIGLSESGIWEPR